MASSSRRKEDVTENPCASRDALCRRYPTVNRELHTARADLRSVIVVGTVERSQLCQSVCRTRAVSPYLWLRQQAPKPSIYVQWMLNIASQA